MSQKTASQIDTANHVKRKNIRNVARASRKVTRRLRNKYVLTPHKVKIAAAKMEKLNAPTVELEVTV